MRFRRATRLALNLFLLAATAVGAVSVGSGSAGVAQPGSPEHSQGYWIVASDGGVYQFRTTNFGGMRGTRLTRPVVGAAATADGQGYWMVASDGGIFTFGDAAFHGSTGNITLNKPIAGMAGDSATNGYWMVASDGGIFAFDAPFYGSTGNITLNKPVVAMAPTPDGRGYWLVASDGGIFAFGDAGFFGSTGDIKLNEPIVGIAPTFDGRGYWLVASDGGIFAFGDAGFYGSTGDIKLNKPIVGMAGAPDGGGYWMVASDGGIFAFGDAQFLGSAAPDNSPAPIVTMVSTPYAYPFPPGATGYDISRYQCPGDPYQNGSIPSQQTPVAIVQASGGQIANSSYNQCYAAEAQWAGANLSSYIFMDELPSPAPSEAMTGPAGNCAPTDTVCQGYNFGAYWARYWVQWSRQQGYTPSLWWLDVEQPSDFWANQSQASNSAVIEGGVAGLESMNVIPGIYSTAYQWGVITGGAPSFPGIALWVPGADYISGDHYSAQSICAGTAGTDYQPFAGGHIVLAQYGYYAGHTGDDQDYSCP